MLRLGSGFLVLGVAALACALAGCGSSEAPEAYPGRPIDPPNKKDDLLEMMTGGSSTSVSVSVTASATATPTGGVAVSAVVAASGSASAKAPKPPKTAKPKEK